MFFQDITFQEAVYLKIHSDRDRFCYYFQCIYRIPCLYKHTLLHSYVITGMCTKKHLF